MFSAPLRLLRGQKKVFFAFLRAPSWIKGGLRCSPRPSVSSADKKRCSSRSFAPLRGSKGFKVFSAPLRLLRGQKRCSPCPSVDQRGLRCSPRPSVPSADKKRCSSRSFAPLRGSKGFKVFSAPLRLLRGQKRCSPCPSVSLRGQKRCSPCPSVDQRGLRCSPRPSVSSADKKRCSSRSFAPLRGSKGFKVFSAPLRALRGQKKGVLRVPSRPFVDQRGSRCSPRPSVSSADKKGVLRAPPCPSVDKKGVLRAPPCPSVDKKGVLRAPPWTKGVQGVLRAPPCPPRTKKRCSSRSFAPLRGSKWFKVFSAPLRLLRGQKRFSPCPSVPLRAPPWIKRVQGVLRAPPSIAPMTLHR